MSSNKSEKSVVVLKELPKQTWHGKTGKDSFAADKKVEAVYSSEVGGYDTGLTDEEVKKYEAKLGVKLDNIFNPDEPHPFWGSRAGTITLTKATQFFDITKPRDFVLVKLMKRSARVANSYKEWEEGKFPKATHFIFDEAEEAQHEAGAIAKEQNALLAVMKMNTESKISLLMLLIGKNYRGKGEDIINVEMAKIIKDKDQVDAFLKYHAMGIAEVTLRAQVLEMIQRQILSKDGTAIYYISSQIGYDFDAAVEYLQNPDNQKLKVVLLEKLQTLQG